MVEKVTKPDERLAHMDRNPQGAHARGIAREPSADASEAEAAQREEEMNARDEPGFTGVSSSGSQGGRALFGEDVEEPAGDALAPSRADRAPVGWQGPRADGDPEHSGPLASARDVPPRARRDAPERQHPRAGATAVTPTQWDENNARKGTARGIAEDEPPVE